MCKIMTDNVVKKSNNNVYILFIGAVHNQKQGDVFFYYKCVIMFCHDNHWKTDITKANVSPTELFYTMYSLSLCSSDIPQT